MPQSNQDGIILVDAQAGAPRPAGPFYGRGYQGGWPTFATSAGNGGSLLVTDLKDVPGNHYVIRALSLRRHAQRMLVADAGGGVAPVSSPDGRSLVYQDQRGRIVVRRVSGGRARVLIRNGCLEDWASR